jgi:hypothetical protein
MIDWVAIATSGGVGVFGAALITAWNTRKKLSSEAAAVLTQAASGLVTNLQTDLETQRSIVKSEREAHEARMYRLEIEHRQELCDVYLALREHSEWDHKAREALIRVGVELPPPPALPDQSRGAKY